MTAKKSNKKKTPERPTRVVGYIRVSTAGQADNGVSLDTQRERLRAYAVAMGLDLVAIEVDGGASARTLDRPALNRALARLEEGEADGLLVAKLDRLTRSVRDLGWLVEPERFGERWSLLSVGDSIDTRTAGGRLVLNVLASVSQWEREAIGERTAETLDHLRRQGVRLGRAGYGVRHAEKTDESGRRVVQRVGSEARVVRRMVRLRKKGMTFDAIAEQLNADGVPTKLGGQWYPNTVRRIVQREMAR